MLALKTENAKKDPARKMSSRKGGIFRFVEN